MWMKVELRVAATWVGVPGILYDEANEVIDTVVKFAAWLDALGLSNITKIAWQNPCDGNSKVYYRIQWYPYWTGDVFNIYPGQGLEIQAETETQILPLKFGQGYKKSLICTDDDAIDYYCEWSGQEEFDKL